MTRPLPPTSFFFLAAAGALIACSASDQPTDDGPNTTGGGGAGGAEGDSGAHRSQGDGDGDSDVNAIEGVARDSFLCVGPAATTFERCGDYALAAGEPLDIAVSGEYPIQHTLGEHGCEAVVEGATITVTSWMETSSQGDEGPDVNASADIACSTGPLEAGEYTIIHGDETFSVEVGADNVQLCNDEHDSIQCCLEDSECPASMECSNNECEAIRCSTAADCPGDQICQNARCRACSCDEGLTCNPFGGDCGQAEATGPGYGACTETSDCGARYELCLTGLDVCAANCQSTSDCADAPEGFEASCINHDGVTDGSMCVIDCSDDGSCPEGLTCKNGLFCSSYSGPRPVPTDGPCTIETSTSEMTCERSAGNNYNCTCSYSSAEGDGAWGMTLLADSCDDALQSQDCGG